MTYNLVLCIWVVLAHFVLECICWHAGFVSDHLMKYLFRGSRASEEALYITKVCPS